MEREKVERKKGVEGERGRKEKRKEEVEGGKGKVEGRDGGRVGKGEGGGRTKGITNEIRLHSNFKPVGGQHSYRAMYYASGGRPEYEVALQCIYLGQWWQA